MRSRSRAVLHGVAGTVLFFALLETAVRLAYFARGCFVEVVPVPYHLGDDFGAVPPWIDRDRVLESDDELLWRNRGGARISYADLFVPFASEEDRAALTRRFLPGLPEPLRQAKRWTVAIDSRGFRDDEFSAQKPPGTFRVLCLGDSWTFGANVTQDETYPRALGRLLAERFPGKRIEVLNLGVLGYSSFQGRALLRSEAIAFDADLFVFGFAMNDGRVAGFQDKGLASTRVAPAARVLCVLEMSETFKLLRYWALRLRERPPAGDAAFRAAAEHSGAQSAADAARYASWIRVPLADYEANLRDMIGVAKSRGAAVVLLDAELERGAYGDTLERLARGEGLPFVRADRLIAAAKLDEARRLEARLRLAPSATPFAGERRPPARVSGGEPADERVPVVLRAYAGEVGVPRALYVVGDDPALGALAPNRVALRDDGEQGDERAHDGVWSLRVRLPRGSVVRYAVTNSGPGGSWQGLDVPAVRTVRVPRDTRRAVFAPIEPFGAVPFQSDAWHTDAAGLARIAESIAAAVERQPAFLRYVRSEPSGSPRRSAALARSRTPGG